MVIGVCKILISIDGSFSLKDKRSVVKSLIGRVKSRYNVSIAEVDINDTWKNSIIGFACVSNEAAHLDRIINNILDFIEYDGRAIINDYSKEITHM